MKVLVTGVTGRIGANLAFALIKKGYLVRGLVMPGDPKADKAKQLGVEVVEADLGDAAGVQSAVDGVDMVAHLAAQMLQGKHPVDRMFVVNTMGTLNLLEGALKASRPVQRFLFASTDQTYSPYVLERTTFYEEHLQKPGDIYGLGKYLSEQTCIEYMREYGLPVTIVRYSSVLAGDEALMVLSPPWLKFYIDLWTAPGRVPWFGADKVEQAKSAVEAALEEPDAAVGVVGPDGDSWALPFTDVRDTVAGTILALESADAIGGAFNMVGPVPTAYGPAARLIAENTERPYLQVQMPFLWAFFASNAKARATLNYDPQYDFAKMVESALAFRRGEDIGVIPV